MEKEPVHSQEDVSKDLVQLVCFKLDTEEYAFNIMHVQEVVRLQRITPLPQMPPCVLGVINIRGTVVPVYDLRKKLVLPEKPFDDETKILVILEGGEMYSYLVDEMLDNVKVEQTDIEPSPEVSMKVEKECVYGIAMIDGRMVTILDVRNITDAIEKEITATLKQ